MVIVVEAMTTSKAATALMDEIISAVIVETITTAINFRESLPLPTTIISVSPLLPSGISPVSTMIA